MGELAETLIGLLDGDLVRLETADLDVEAEVTDHEREVHEGSPEGDRWRYAIRFMPVGEDATAVDADRYRVRVLPDGRGGWLVEELVAEVYVEAELDYRSEPRGDLVAVDVLDGP